MPELTGGNAADCVDNLCTSKLSRLISVTTADRLLSQAEGGDLADRRLKLLVSR